MKSQFYLTRLKPFLVFSMDIITIAVVCILTTIICKLFSNNNKEYALYIKITASVGILAAVIIYISPIAEMINNIFAKSGADVSYINILIKALGICYIVQFACDICKDSGEGALAAQLETAGKISLILLALPLFETLVDIVMSLYGM